MSLAPNVDVTLGGLRYDSHVSSLRVTLTLLPAVNSFSLILPAGVKFTAVPGDAAELIVDSGDSAGDGSQNVLTGKVRSVRRSVHKVVVTGADAGADLAAFRPATTYQKQDAAAITKALAAEAGVSSGDVDIDLDLAAFAAHQGRSASEHVAFLATLAGCIAGIGGDGKLNVLPLPGKQAQEALLFGRELIEVQKREGSPLAVQRFAVGSGTAGSAGSTEALKHSLLRLPEDAAAPGKKAVWYPAPVVRTPGVATAAARALNDRAAAYTQQMRARCFLLTGLRPGIVVEMQEVPSGLGGSNWLLTRVTHRLQPGTGGETILEGVQAGASGDSLLGALLGALGALL
jgi:prophage tail gpP-like protein